VRFTAVRTLGAVAQADSIGVGEQDVEGDDVEIVDLLHEPTVVLGVFLERVDPWESGRCDEAVVRGAQVGNRLCAGTAGSVGNLHVFADEVDVVLFAGL